MLAEGSIEHVRADPRVIEVYLGDETTPPHAESMPSTCITAPRRRCAASRFKAEPGKVTCVLGRNGVGKTSLLRAIAASMRSARGTILLEGEDMTGCRPPIARARGIAYVPQGREIFRCSQSRRISRRGLRR